MQLFVGREKEYRKEQSRETRRKSPLRCLFNQARFRAKKKGVAFEICLDDLEIPVYCPVFGLKLQFNPGRRQDNSYSIDRLDNGKGYTKENSRVISWRANQYKGNLSIEEVESLLRYMKG